MIAAAHPVVRPCRAGMAHPPLHAQALRRHRSARLLAGSTVPVPAPVRAGRRPGVTARR